MNLSQQQKQVGKENFADAVAVTRRDFLTGTVAAGLASGVGLGSLYFGYGSSVGDPLRIGVIGTGDEGSVLIGAHNPDYMQVKAIAEIRPYNVYRAFHGDMSSPNAYRARPGLMAKYGWKSEDEGRKKVKVYAAYEELLADDAIEAVVIALPLHLHAEAAIKAMRAGKHVLTEKLMGHSVHECKEMGRVAAETGKLLATGHQRHYSVLYDDAVYTIGKARLIGDVHSIRAQWHRGNLPGKDSWKPPLPGDEALAKKLVSWRRARDNAKPSEAEAWQKKVAQLEAQLLDAEVDAAGFGYEEKTLPDGGIRSPLEELVRWRLWNRTGGGLMAELGSHHFHLGDARRGQEGQAADGARHGQSQHLPGRPRGRRPRLLHLRVSGPRLLRCRRQCGRPQQEDRGHLLLDQRQRLRWLRRGRDGYRGHADPRAGAGCDALQGLFAGHPRECHQG